MGSYGPWGTGIDGGARSATDLMSYVPAELMCDTCVGVASACACACACLGCSSLTGVCSVDDGAVVMLLCDRTGWDALGWTGRFQHALKHAHSYFNFGAGCSEVEVDILSGEHEIIRTDIVYDLSLIHI